MQQRILKNCKVVGLENVSYTNYLGNPVSGARVSFAAMLPESPNNEGVIVHYQWITSDKLPRDIKIGNYYDIAFNVDEQKGNKFFDKLLRPADLVEFDFVC